MAELYIAGTFIGALLVLVLAFWINGRRKRHSSILRSEKGIRTGGADSFIARLLSNPLIWVVVFIAILIGAFGATIGLLTGQLELEGGAWLAVALIFGVLLAGFVIYNVYAVARNRGHSTALSIGESVAVLVLLLFVGLVALLIGA